LISAQAKRIFISMEIGAHLIVSGRVQGVGFRFFLSEKASALGLNGYARNLFNGEVEIDVEGDRSLIEAFIKEVKVGPRMSRVADIIIEWKKAAGSMSRFEIR
jgi:acylphosphatase